MNPPSSSTPKNTENAELSVCYLNIGGVSKLKLNKYVDYVNSNDIDVFAIAETWSSELPYLPAGFKVAAVKHARRREGKTRPSEGITVLVKEPLEAFGVAEVSSSGVGVRVRGINFVFMYQHPDDVRSVDPLFNGTLDTIAGRRTVILGDFNVAEDRRDLEKVCDELAGAGICESKMEGVTFVRGAQSSSPDRVFANFKVFPQNIRTGFTGHSLVRVDVALQRKSSPDVQYVQFNIAKMRRRKHVVEERMDALLDSFKVASNVEDEFRNLESIYMRSFACCRSKGGGKGTFILPPALVEMRRKKNKLKKNLKGNAEQLNMLRKDIKKMFRLLKNNGKLTPRSAATIQQQARLVVAHAMERPVERINTSEDCNNLLDDFLVCKQGQEPYIIENFPVENEAVVLSQDLVSSTIDRLASGKAAGENGIRNEMIKFATPKMRLRTANLFNMVFVARRVPSRWKQVIFYPIRKSVDTFRPIALLDAHRKLFEKCIASLLDYRVSIQQCGFTEGRATVDHALLLDHHLRSGRGDIAAAALDIRKAYDSVDRRILYRKLRERNLDPLVLNVLVCLLEGNMCYVRYNKLESRRRELACGLPQGSILSPMLFNIFIDDVVSYLSPAARRRTLLYADDILLFAYGVGELQEMIGQVERHALDNAYVLNEKKCMYLGRGSPLVNGIEIKKVDKLKYLGFYFNKCGIDGARSVSMIRRSAVYRAAIVKRGLARLSGSVRKPYIALLMYKIFIRPSMDYSLVMLASASVAMLKVERIQRRILKYLFGLPRRTPSSVLYALIPIEDIKTRSRVLSNSAHCRIASRGSQMTRDCVTWKKSKAIKWLKENTESLRNIDKKNWVREMIVENAREVFGFPEWVDLFKQVRNFRYWRRIVKGLDDIVRIDGLDELRIQQWIADFAGNRSATL